MEFFTPKLIIFHLSALSCAALLQPRYSKLILLMYQIKLFLIICLTLNLVPFIKLKIYFSILLIKTFFFVTKSHCVPI